jgi:hypothetical protein
MTDFRAATIHKFAFFIDSSVFLFRSTHHRNEGWEEDGGSVPSRPPEPQVL